MRKAKIQWLVYKVKEHKDTTAFAKLYDLHVERIYRFIFFKVSNKEDAEDLTSDVFLKTWNYLIEPDRDVHSFNGLIYRIARNSVVDLYRARAKKQECALEEVIERVSDQDVNLIKAVDTKMQSEQLLVHLKKLKQEYQEVLQLRYIEELTIAEIADILEKRKNTVRVTVHRALKKLKELSSSATSS